MVTIRDVLSKEDIKNYHKHWSLFEGKYRLSSPKSAHSGMPVISEVYQFEDKPVFRAHVFQRRLRKFNPYFISNKYFHPFWHAQHYFMVMEQLYHAGVNKVRDNSKLIVKDIPERFRWRKPTFWDCPTSAELILEDLGEIGPNKQERACFTFYEDKKNRPIAEVDVMTFYQPRAYLRDLERVKQGDSKAIDALIRKVQRQAIFHREMCEPRTSLVSTETELIEKLKSGEIPEAELHDFFSFWD